MYRKEEKKQYIRKADIFLILICLLAAAALAVCFYIRRDDECLLRISYGGEVLETLELKEDVLSQEAVYYLFLYENNSVVWERSEAYPDIPDDVSFNLLCISPGNIRMEAADCRDQICVDHRPIADGGESIICLPHRLVVEIVGGGNEDTLDGMVN